MKRFTTRDGLALAYDVSDFTDPWTTPDTMLLLHAAMGNSRRWFKWVPRLARQFRVVTMDLRGHGASQMPSPDSPFSLDQLVGDAVELLDLVGARSAHVVGNSAGGYVAQQLAIHHPERVKTLALYGATPGLKHSQALTWIPQIQKIGLKRFLADTIQDRFDGNADPNLVAWFIEQAGSNDPAFIARFVTHMCTHDFMDELPRIQCPTLIVAAGKEAIGHASAYDEMHKRIPNSQLVYYDTAAHNICDGYPDRCVNDLLRFQHRPTG
ncbi:MAG TPA: alpha/beta hydrolase [Casimicrobiaceae bacterium]|nr:alpha/beta hydrolase [Casimicrobiaceae bacterium]